MTVATQDLTLRLPTEIVERIQQTANRSHQSPDAVVAEILRLSLPPLRVQAMQQMQKQIDRLTPLPDEEVRSRVLAQLPTEEQERLSDLLARNRQGTLTSEQAEELEALLDRVEETSTEKAAARWLLKQRKSQV